MRTVATVAPPLAKPEWFASWFDSAHYHRLYSHRDQAEARAFVDRLIDRLEPARGASMLDLGCGSGRHARCLAARGFRVTGLDLSAGSLARARSQSRPDVRYVEQDMRQPFGTNAFDLVFSLFTSFGYFEDARRSLGRDWQHRRGADRRRHAGARLPERASRRAAPGRERRGLSRRGRLQAHPLEHGPGVLQADRDSRSDAAGAARIRRARGEADARGLSAPVRRARPRDRAGLRRLPARALRRDRVAAADSCRSQARGSRSISAATGSCGCGSASRE